MGAQTGRPRARYCANLGHVQDDESGLVYMRARYYEPTSGRFVSVDRVRSGNNWYSYCHNIPTSLTDQSGKTPVPESDLIVGGLGLLLGVALLFTPAAIVGVVLIVISLLYIAYCVHEGIDWGHEENKNIQESTHKQNESSGLDPEELEGMKNSQHGSIDAVETLNMINQLEMLEWMVSE